MFVILDIDRIQATCDMRACEGQFWKVKAVKETRRVKVEGYSLSSSKDKLREYLEKFTTSTVGGVDICSEKEMCIVYLRTQGGRWDELLGAFPVPSVRPHIWLLLCYQHLFRTS